MRRKVYTEKEVFSTNGDVNGDLEYSTVTIFYTFVLFTNFVPKTNIVISLYGQ